PFHGDQFCNPYASATAAWKRANFHAHGLAWLGLSSAAQTDDEVVAAYLRSGYDVAAISNYQKITDSGTIPVYEHGFNVGKQHQLATGARRVAWFDFPFWQSIHQKQYVLDRVARSAELVAIAHPAANRHAYSDDELRRLAGYQLLEVVNGKFTAERSW